MLPALQVSHRLLHINVATNFLDTNKMFASEFVGRKLGEKFCKGTTLPLQVDISPCSNGVLP